MKKVLSVLLALTLVLAMFAISVSAIDGVDVVVEDGKMTLTSRMNLSDDAISAPNVTYTYTLSNGEADIYTVTSEVTAETSKVVIFPGVADSEANSTVETAVFTVNDYATAEHIVEKPVEFEFDADDYACAGVYHYVLTETNDAGTLANLVNETDSTRDIYVTVITDEDDNLVVEKIIMTTEKLTADNGYEKSLGYVHSYGVDPNGDEPGPQGTDSLDFIVTEYTFGSLANKSQKFDFVITTDAPINTVYKTSADTFIIVGENGVLYNAEQKTDETTGAVSYTATTALDLKMSNLESYTILSAAAGSTFDVTILDPAALGYSFENRVYDTTPWINNAAQNTYIMDEKLAKLQGLDFAAVKGSDKGDPDDEEIDYTDSLPDTGVILEFAPYVLMVMLAAAYLVLRVFKTGKKVRS